MNPVIDTIMSRRSIRAYTDAPVDRATLEAVLRATTYAPSAGNRQVWRIVAVTKRSKTGLLGGRNARPRVPNPEPHVLRVTPGAHLHSAPGRCELTALSSRFDRASATRAPSTRSRSADRAM